MIKAIIYAILLLFIFSSTVWDMDDTSSNAIVHLQQALKIPFLDELVSLVRVNDPIKDITEYDKKIALRGLSRQAFSNDLAKLYLIWIPCEKEISNSVQAAHTLIKDCQSHLNNLSIKPDSVESETVRLISIIDFCLNELNEYISDFNLNFLFEKILLNHSELFPFFKPSVKPTNHSHIDHAKLVSVLYSVSIIYRYFSSLEFTFDELERNINMITWETSNQDKDDINKVTAMRKKSSRKSL